MFFSYAFFICYIIGNLKGSRADIDINRLRRLSNSVQHFDSSIQSTHYIHGRRSVDFDQIKKTYDYGDHSSTLYHTPSHILYPAPSSYLKNAIKIHQPRENPKLYYQSDAFLKEISSKNMDHEVAATYPGREVIRAGEYEAPSLLPRRRYENLVYPVHKKCIRCPRDRTLVTKIGSDRVFLQTPRPLVTCTGHRASSTVKFVHMYGPKFGSFLTQGSHVIVGRITFNGETLNFCKIEVNVIFQSCPIPKYLVASCTERDRFCNFTCKDSSLETIGSTTVACGINMEWETELPFCRARNWCYPPTPPEQGHLSCKGKGIGKGVGLLEGSKCRVRCDPEWRPYPRGVAVCRRGLWTHNLQCQPKNRSPRR